MLTNSTDHIAMDVFRSHGEWDVVGTTSVGSQTRRKRRTRTRIERRKGRRRRRGKDIETVKVKEQQTRTRRNEELKQWQQQQSRRYCKERTAHEELNSTRRSTHTQSAPRLSALRNSMTAIRESCFRPSDSLCIYVASHAFTSSTS